MTQTTVAGSPLRALQRQAADALGRILEGGEPLHRILPGLTARLAAPRDRAAVQDWLYGTLRHHGRLRAVLDALLARPLTDPALGWLLELALYQLAYTRVPAHVVVHNAVEAAGSGWRRGLANAVLRGFLRQRAALETRLDADPVARWSHPVWWIDALRESLPAGQVDAVLQASLAHPPFTLRVNCRKCSVTRYLETLAKQGIAARQTGESAVTLAEALPVEEVPGFAEGVVSVQDAGAQWAAPLLDARDHMRVLDACAAPGGKTGHLLERANLDLVALDTDPARLDRVRANLDRLGLAATLVCGDAAQPAGWWDGRPFDRILADVPCSASGVVRRNPDVKWLRRPGDIARFATQQAAILDALWPLLTPGGKLLYATCSLMRAENAAQAEAFVRRHDDARRDALPAPLIDGTLLPHADHDGFFYAAFTKLG